MGTRTVEEVNSSLISKSLAKLINTTNDKHENKVRSYHQSVLEAKAIYTIEKPQKKKTAKDKLMKNYWERDPRVAKAALVMHHFKCEIDPKHSTFTSQVTGESYVEAHHLIPMKVQAEFEYSLDVTGNIVSLCPNCHRAIHLATLSKKKEMINKLYMTRRDKLKKFGIYVSFDKLFGIYKHM
jgi:5-methylcytosine-specific restriction protein A